jgi:hypothetical protein
MNEQQTRDEQKELLKIVGVDEQDAEDMIDTWDALDAAQLPPDDVSGPKSQ